MSETTAVETPAVVAVETPAVRVINITSKEEFVKVASEYGIKVGERGNLPRRALFAAVLSDIVDGKVKLIPTGYLSPDVQNKTPREAKVKPVVSYVITYKMVADGAPSGDDLTLSLTENEVRSYLPHVKGQVSAAYATMVLALFHSEESTSVASVLKYAVSDVERVESFPVSESVAETTEEAPKGDDTQETNTDADKTPETVEEVHASEEMINAAIAAGEEAAKAATKPAAKPRASRKTVKANA